MKMEETDKLLDLADAARALRVKILTLRKIRTGEFSHQSSQEKELGSFVQRELNEGDVNWLLSLLQERFEERLEALPSITMAIANAPPAKA